MLSQALAPSGPCMSFANHNIFEIHISNYILLSKLTIPSLFIQPGKTFENVICSAEMSRITGDCKNPQINQLVTVRHIRD